MSCQIIIIRNHPAANPDPRCHGGHPYVDEIIRQEGPEASHLLIRTSTRQLIRRYLLEFVAYQSSRGRDSAKSIERNEPIIHRTTLPATAKLSPPPRPLPHPPRRTRAPIVDAWFGGEGPDRTVARCTAPRRQLLSWPAAHLPIYRTGWHSTVICSR